MREDVRTPGRAPSARHILTLSCANRPGIVAKVSAALFDGGFNILDAQQFDDTETGDFFMRVEFNAACTDANVDALREAFTDIAAGLRMTWSMRPADQRKRVALMVSRFDHCLVDLLYRWRSGELPMEPVAIIANHPRETYAHIDLDGVPFHYLPITRETKMEQEAEAWQLIKSAKADLVVLARYMQILPARMCRQAGGARHQHPPLVPAQLQGRQALSPGPCPRRQDHRRQRPFRHRRSRRGADHRARGRAGRPQGDPGRSGGHRPRHRERGAVAGGALLSIEERRVLLNGSKTVVFEG